MSDTDSFITEVTEELRQDRMWRLWRRFGPFVIGAIVALIAAAAVVTWMDQQARAAAEADGAAIATAADTEDAGERAEKLAALDLSGEGAGLVADLLRAGAQKDAEDAEGALATLEAVAANPAADAIYRDLARIKILQLRQAQMTPPEIEQAANDLVGPGAPFRLLALEIRAMARLRAGGVTDARADLEEILGDPTATNELRQRATALLASL